MCTRELLCQVRGHRNVRHGITAGLECLRWPGELKVAIIRFPALHVSTH